MTTQADSNPVLRKSLAPAGVQGPDNALRPGTVGIMIPLISDDEWPMPLPDVVLDCESLVRHRPREHYGRRSYWTKCRVLSIDFPVGVKSSSDWVEDCPQCFPKSGGDE